MAANKKLIFCLLTVIVCGVLVSVPAAAQTNLDPTPPNNVVKLIFIHHSVGENWLADGYGNLGITLQENNYFVSDTNYGWGPDGIGDRTDTLDWPEWFVGPNSDRYLAAVYQESDANAGGWDYYSRTLADPGGENQIIVFKSCFPNSDLGGSPNDPPAPGDDLTVASAKYVYNQLLTYFETRPDKLFVVITSPPMQYISQPENARAFNNWLVYDWLEENDYPYHNVVVFDLYNVLTHPDNHHRFNNGVIEHITSGGSNTLYYDSDGDDHPSAAGSQKATDEFVTLLNVYYHLWQNDEASPPPADIAPGDGTGDGQQGGQQDQPPFVEPGQGGVIDDFESGPIPDTDYWVTYWDEAVDTTISCQPTTASAAQGTTSLQIDFNVLAQSWASCELLFYSPQNWEGEGFSYYLQTSNPGVKYHILFYYQQGEEHGTSAITLTAPPESVGQWAQVDISWDEFSQQDSLVYPDVALGMAFIVEGEDDQANTGTIWIDDLRWGTADSEAEEPGGESQEPESGVNAAGNSFEEEEKVNGGGGLPFCGNLPLIVGAVGLGAAAWRKRKV